AVPEEDLGAVDVAHAGDDLLVHQQRGDGRTAAADPAVRGGRVRVGAERVGAEAGVHGLLLGVGDEGAGGGSAQVGVAAVTGEAQAHGVGGRRRGGRSEGDLAEQAEVDVDPVGVPGAGVAEAEEEVFAVGVGGVQGAAVEQGGRVAELALGAGDPQRAAAREGGRVVLGQPVNRVPLRHRVPF